MRLRPAPRGVTLAGQTGTGIALVPGCGGIFARLSGLLPLANGFLFRVNELLEAGVFDI